MKITVPEGIAKLCETLCDCGSEMAWQTVRDYLEGFGRADLPKPVVDNGPTFIVASLLDSIGLIDHGLSLRCAWTTHAGADVAAFLREHGSAWQKIKGVKFITTYGGEEVQIGGET